MDWRRLDLAEIEANLAAVARTELADGTSGLPEEPLTPDAVRRLLAGYRYVDDLLAQRVDIFCYGQTRHVLEINHLVLCGTSPERRQQFQSHLLETERRFYDRPGIGDFMEWYKRNRTRPAPSLAAGIFLRVLSAPQLFIEGNSRTAALLASYTLARAGFAPLVVTEASFSAYVGIVERCIDVDRDGFASLFSGLLALRRLTAFLTECCEMRFLAAPKPGDLPLQDGQSRSL